MWVICIEIELISLVASCWCHVADWTQLGGSSAHVKCSSGDQARQGHVSWLIHVSCAVTGRLGFFSLSVKSLVFSSM